MSLNFEIADLRFIWNLVLGCLEFTNAEISGHIFALQKYKVKPTDPAHLVGCLNNPPLTVCSFLA